MSCPPTQSAACPLHAAPRLADTLRRYDAEAEHGVCETGRYRCRYARWGQGPPLVLIPGMGADARAFAPLMQFLVEHFRCITYDLPAGGEDGARLDRYRPEDYAADLLALLDHLQVPQAYLLGVSFGSTVALQALHTAPTRLPRAALQGGFAHRPLALAERLLVRLLRHWHGRAGMVPFRSQLLKSCHFAPFAGQPEMWDYFLETAGNVPVHVLAQRALVLHDLDLRPVLPAIRQPLLLVTGEVDALVSSACSEELAKGLPNAGQIQLKGCGHYAQFTHTAELADVLVHFFTPAR
jgi:pimeloyl-ACP methyl ester carboxylesterase